MARRLVEENIALRAELAELQAEREGLLARIAGDQFAYDRLQVGPERLPDAGQAQEDLAPSGWQVLDGNAALGLVAVSAGARAGLRTGMSVAVLRGSAVVARARIVEVRDRVAAARVEALVTGQGFPQEGDRVVVWRPRGE